MLTYVSFGPRDFGDRPHAPTARPNWEIYAVLRGRLAPSLPGETTPRPQSRALWLFPPGRVHGWVGEPGRRAIIAVFHFDEVPAALARAATDAGGWMVAPLSAKDTPRLARLARELQPRWWREDPLLEFHGGAALMELAILLLSSRAAERAAPPATLRVRAAEVWLRSHFHERPGVRDLARLVGVSPPHLRRLYLTELGCSPKEWMSRVQLDVAADLLARSDLKLEAVAASSGFASCSTLCHAFRAACGLTPTDWRSWFGENRSS
ncbi:MAG: AraC family transcriptional regulator [Opitutaceae bacterium]|jgi:AraC-like DNA-binding protein|nr:AraC family transcriptional regulator [Opitutaceae bacterium]